MKNRLLKALPFILIILLFVYISNWVVYAALAAIFSINAPWMLATIGASIGFLSASFIASSILGRSYYNAFTRTYSWLSSIWIGLFVYLFLASIAYALLVVLPAGSHAGIGMLFVMFALMLGAYGIFHARTTHVAEIKVSLPHLPAAWAGKKAVWISDMHLGQIHGAEFARRIVEKIKALQCDIIFIGGDLYDGTSAPDPRELIDSFKGLSAPLGIYFITGNHEEYGNREKFISAIRSVGIEVVQDALIEIDGMQVIGVDYHTTSERGQFQKILSGILIDRSKPSILLKHEPKDLDVARDAGVSLQISGHTHKAQLWPLGYVADIVYKGFAYGMKKTGKMQIYTSSGVGTWGPPMRVGSDSEMVVFAFERNQADE